MKKKHKKETAGKGAHTVSTRYTDLPICAYLLYHKNYHLSNLH